MRLRNKLTPDEITDLHADIETRAELQHAMAANANPVLEAELGISLSVIRQIQVGNYPESTRRVVSPAMQSQILRRRHAWMLANEAMQDYTQAAMTRRHNISAMTLHRHIWIVRRAAWQQTLERKAA